MEVPLFLDEMSDHLVRSEKSGGSHPQILAVLAAYIKRRMAKGTFARQRIRPCLRLGSEPFGPTQREDSELGARFIMCFEPDRFTLIGIGRRRHC